jgi:hypothetical protein
MKSSKLPSIKANDGKKTHTSLHLVNPLLPSSVEVENTQIIEKCRILFDTLLDVFTELHKLHWFTKC